MPQGFQYGARGSLPCHPGPTWHQGMARAPDGTITMSEKFTGDDAQERVNDAIQHHYRTGKWPREAEPQQVCGACGQPLPDEA